MEVSVLCLAYNHEKYIKKCLDSILAQKTNFKYEIIINDDASTDNTTNIIKEYEEKYPEIIKPIYQIENKYSKGEAIVEEYMLPKATGKYIAFCECDDWWLSDDKLQKQYDYMELNDECVLCGHNTLVHCINSHKKDMYFNDWKEIHTMTPREAFLEWKIHTSSFFMKKTDGYRLEFSRKYWFGDYVRLTELFINGKVVVLPYTMSQYNYGVKTGALYSADNTDIESRKENILQRKYYLEQLLTFKNSDKYSNIIKERIYHTELEAETISEDTVLRNEMSSNREIRKAAYNILRKKELKQYLNCLTIKHKIKTKIKYCMYIICPFIIKKRKGSM